MENDPDPNSFSSKMWRESTDVADLALGTKFIQRIGNGDLDPNSYASYMVQDVVYCYHSERTYKKISDRAIEKNFQEIASFSMARFESYCKYNATLRKQWHIPPEVADSLELGEAARSYIDFAEDVAGTLPPIYGLVMKIPCRRLWPYLAERLRGKATDGNLYRFWIEENGSFKGANRLDNFVNEWAKNHPDDFNEDLAILVYRTAMVAELNFFRSVFGEQPALPLPYYETPDTVRHMAMEGTGL